MPDSDGTKKCSSNGPIAVLILFAALVAYPLSYGPVAGGTSRGWLSVSFLRPYDPLFWALDSGPHWLRWPFYEWVDLWLEDLEHYTEVSTDLEPPPEFR
jgi:hypothetical protein